MRKSTGGKNAKKKQEEVPEPVPEVEEFGASEGTSFDAIVKATGIQIEEEPVKDEQPSDNVKSSEPEVQTETIADNVPQEIVKEDDNQEQPKNGIDITDKVDPQPDMEAAVMAAVKENIPLPNDVPTEEHIAFYDQGVDHEFDTNAADMRPISNLRKNLTTRLQAYQNKTNATLGPVYSITRDDGTKYYFKLPKTSREQILDGWDLCRGKISSERYIMLVVDILKLPRPKFSTSFDLVEL